MRLSPTLNLKCGGDCRHGIVNSRSTTSVSNTVLVFQTLVDACKKRGIHYLIIISTRYSGAL